MRHPSLAAIIAHLDDEAARPELGAHLDACGLCRQLAGLGDPVTRRGPVPPITVDGALYAGREPLRAGHAGMGRSEEHTSELQSR